MQYVDKTCPKQTIRIENSRRESPAYYLDFIQVLIEILYLYGYNWTDFLGLVAPTLTYGLAVCLGLAKTSLL